MQGPSNFEVFPPGLKMTQVWVIEQPGTVICGGAAAEEIVRTTISQPEYRT